MSNRQIQRASADDILRVDKALSLVQGSFVAAGKLVDASPQKIANLVAYHPALAKWRHARCGRPARSLDFRIKPYREIQALEDVSLAALALPAEQRERLRQLLNNPPAVLRTAIAASRSLTGGAAKP